MLPILFEMAEKLEPEHGITIRGMRRRDMQGEITRFMDIYNAAWEKNWGFVPLTETEVRHYAKELKPILDENWAMVAETKEGETVGVALTLPDYNQVLKELNGRLLPLGWLKALRERKKIDKVRVFALGVKPEYQHTGVAAGLYERHLRHGRHHAPGRRRDGLDPRVERADEPRHGGDGRHDRQDLPDLRQGS